MKQTDSQHQSIHASAHWRIYQMQKYSLTIISLSREDTFVLSVMQLSRERERPVHAFPV